jgi:hypothetical protein
LTLAARTNTAVPRIDDNEHAVGCERSIECGGNIFTESLLQLRPRSDHVEKPGNGAKAHQVFGGQVGDVGNTGEGQQVVLADRPQLKVAQQNHFATLASVSVPCKLIAQQRNRERVAVW